MSNSTDVLVVGNGAREYAIAVQLSRSQGIGEVCVAPGNGGTGRLVQNVPINATDIQKLVRFAKSKRIGLTVVGSENPLAEGIVDLFQANDLPIFGPTKAAARIETSKAFAKDLMVKAGIPTPNYQVFDNQAKALEYIQSGRKPPMVIKADGPAHGKGVYVCNGLLEARWAVDQLMQKRVHGSAGDRIVVEDKVNGYELSLGALVDGTRGENGFHLLPFAQDHKRLLDNDNGSNTAGMGGSCPVPGFEGGLTMGAVTTGVIRPILDAMQEAGYPFTGMLYPGAMMTPDGMKILEVNCRPGDPEWQLYARLLETDFLEVLQACVQKKLREVSFRWRPGFAACVVLTSRGYPGKYKEGFIISGLDAAEEIPGVEIFHAGTVYDKSGFSRTAGGRVLAVTGIGNTLQEALDWTYEAARLIEFEGKHYRGDIGRNALARQLQQGS